MIEEINITEYKTSDETIFKNKESAIKHEFDIQLRKDLFKKIGIKSHHVESYISIYKEQILDVLENLKIEIEGEKIYFKSQSDEKIYPD